MRYLKSFLFDLGLVLVVIGVTMAMLPRSISKVVSQTASFTAHSTDYDLTAPAGLVVTGLILGVIGATKVHYRISP
jgi:uncharacterized protein YjeT (DUF2065 family)